MILIHVPVVTNRLIYTFDLVFKDILKIKYALTSDVEEFTGSGQPKFSYGRSKIGDNLYFQSTGLLFEKDIRQQPIQFFRWGNIPAFFKTIEGDLPLDIFSASFYLVSRYEEYLPHIRDKHNRFRHQDSAAFKGHFLEKPVVNIWAMELRKILEAKFPSLYFPTSTFSFTPTIDIDNAYAYKHKGVMRSGGVLLKRLAKFEYKRFMNRLLVHLGYQKDPYDSYEKQRIIHRKYNVKPIYFVLLGDYGVYDKNLSPDNKHFAELIRSLQDEGCVGLHPSYASNKSPDKLSIEKARLESILNGPVTKSRQHYIKLHLPGTYRNMLKLGIREDYSMGYPSMLGFRASICMPFYFFDIEEDKQTSLRIFPFVAMDSTLKFYLKIRSKDVVNTLKPLVNEIRKAGGNFTFIFHNESIGSKRNWKNWGDMYEKVIRLSLEDE